MGVLTTPLNDLTTPLCDLTTPLSDVTFGDVIDGRCPDDQGTLMNNGLGFDVVQWG